MRLRSLTGYRYGQDAPDRMINPMATSQYNYERFDEYVESGVDLTEFSAFPNRLHAGDEAPDATLVLLDDGSEVRLSDLWARRNLVVEFGSFT